MSHVIQYEGDNNTFCATCVTWKASQGLIIGMGRRNLLNKKSSDKDDGGDDSVDNASDFWNTAR